MRWRRLQRYSNCKRRWCEGTHTFLRPVVCSSTGLINICGNRIGEKDDEISLPQDCQIYPTDPEWLGQVLSSPSHQWEWIHPQLTSKVSSCGYAEQSKKPPKEGGSVVIWICGVSVVECLQTMGVFVYTTSGSAFLNQNFSQLAVLEETMRDNRFTSATYSLPSL